MQHLGVDPVGDLEAELQRLGAPLVERRVVDEEAIDAGGRRGHDFEVYRAVLGGGLVDLWMRRQGIVSL
jgi:hypothetical protein